MSTTEISNILARALDGEHPSNEEALLLANETDLALLSNIAGQLRDRGHGDLVTYSRKVFIPLTKLCRDVCHYCTFAHPPRKGQRAYLTADEVLDIARQGRAAGCHEALFTLGDKPELRYRVARERRKRPPVQRRAPLLCLARIGSPAARHGRPFTATRHQ